MKLYKYQVLRSDRNISVGDVLRGGKDNSEQVKIISIVKIDTDEMILYFYGVLLSEIDEQDEDETNDDIDFN